MYGNFTITFSINEDIIITKIIYEKYGINETEVYVQQEYRG